MARGRHPKPRAPISWMDRDSSLARALEVARPSTIAGDRIPPRTRSAVRFIDEERNAAVVVHFIYDVKDAQPNDDRGYGGRRADATYLDTGHIIVDGDSSDPLVRAIVRGLDLA